MTYQQDTANPSAGLWKNEEGKPAGYGGKITITEPGDYFVNLYKNDKKEPGSKQPDLNLRFKRMEKQSQPQRPAEPAFVDDDIGF